MDQLVASVDHLTFDLETSLSKQTGALPLPFAGMDKSGAAICEFYVRATCPKGTACPFRSEMGLLASTVGCKTRGWKVCQMPSHS